ncbi:hypothetical protein Btru_017177 [Bulinus truncatus]|nr:hypothetical protein Btru_017177 [Bulinus truncatus]
MVRPLYTWLFLHIYSFIDISATHQLFCREQEQEVYACSAKMQDAYIIKNNNFHMLCSELSQYLSCVEDSELTCPKMSVFKDTIFLNAVKTAKDIYTTVCTPRSPVPYRACSLSTMSRLVRHCNYFVDKVQPDTSLTDICQINVHFLGCLEWINEVCENSPALNNYSIPLAITSSREFLHNYCRDCNVKLLLKNFQ